MARIIIVLALVITAQASAAESVGSLPEYASLRFERKGEKVYAKCDLENRGAMLIMVSATPDLYWTIDDSKNLASGGTVIDDRRFGLFNLLMPTPQSCRQKGLILDYSVASYRLEIDSSESFLLLLRLDPQGPGKLDIKLNLRVVLVDPATHEMCTRVAAYEARISISNVWKNSHKVPFVHLREAKDAYEGKNRTEFKGGKKGDARASRFPVPTKAIEITGRCDCERTS